jgi:hypothetical protein
VQTPSERTREQVGEREQASLRVIEHVQVFDGLVDLTVFQVVQVRPVVAFQQHAHERVEEMHVLRGRVERKGVNRHVALTKSDLEVSTLQECRELAIAVPEIEDDGQRIVLLRVRDQEVDEKALAAPGGPKDQRVAHILHVQVERVRRVVRRLEDGQRFLMEMRADSFALIEGEQKTEIGEVGLQQREPAQVVRVVARHNAQPGVEQVIGFLEHTAVVDRHHFHGFGRAVLKRSRVLAMQDECQGAHPEEMAVDFEFGQRFAQLVHGGAGRVVDEHVLGSRVGRDVIHQGDTFVEKVPAAPLDVLPHPIVRNPLPFETGDELAGNHVEVPEQVGKGPARRFLHGQHFDESATNHQVIAVAVDGGIRNEIIEVCVVGEAGRCGGRGIAVHELSEEPEGIRLGESFRADVAQLHLERLRLVMECSNRPVQFRFKQRHRMTGRQPGQERFLWRAPEMAEPRTRADGRWPFVDEHEVQSQVVEFAAAAIQVTRPLLDSLVDNDLWTRRGDDLIDRPLDGVLIHTTTVVEQPKRRFEPMDQGAALGVRQTLIIDASEPVHDADVAGLREERRVVDEAPQRQETVETAGLAVVAENARDAHHPPISTWTGSCFPGSYRRRACEDAIRMRSISGSRFVAHRAKPYRPPNINKPARNE